MNIQTGWTNDDFLLDQFRMRLSDDENMIEFIVKQNKNGVINNDLYNRLLVKKAIRVFTNTKKHSLPDYFLGCHKLN